jgi:hypothetical protein
MQYFRFSALGSGFSALGSRLRVGFIFPPASCIVCRESFVDKKGCTNKIQPQDILLDDIINCLHA